MTLGIPCVLDTIEFLLRERSKNIRLFHFVFRLHMSLRSDPLRAPNPCEADREAKTS